MCFSVAFERKDKEMRLSTEDNVTNQDDKNEIRALISNVLD